MANLTHLFKVGQAVKVKADTYDNTLYNGTVKETYPDHIIVDVPEISDHMWYEEDLNLDWVYPDYNF